MKFLRLAEADGTWQRFVEDWKSQCERLGEDFDAYLSSPISIVHDLAVSPLKPEAGAYAIEDENGSFLVMCQLNVTPLPGYVGDVLRVRMLYFSPMYDVGEQDLQSYAKLLVALFFRIVTLSRDLMPARHIKFHLPSPNDRSFFSMLGSELRGTGEFEKVEMRGAWLYISKSSGGS